MSSTCSGVKPITSTTTEASPRDDAKDTTATLAGGPREPRHSSAAQMIQFQIGSAAEDESEQYLFGPEFTHQCFPGEAVRGYQPPARNNRSSLGQQEDDDDEEEKNDNKILQIHITLAPDCASCQILLHVSDPPRTRSSNRRRRPAVAALETSRNKRPRIDGNNNTQTKENETAETLNGDDSPFSSVESVPISSSDDGNGDNNEADDDGSYTLSDVDKEDAAPESNAEGSTRKRRMPLQQVREQLSKALPKVMDNNVDISRHYLSSPVGQVLDTYCVGTQQEFCICLAKGSDPSVAAYHHQVQNWAVWFIETAENVDIASINDGSWSVVYLFRKHATRQYSLAGFMTLFFFPAPFRKPQPGTIVRVCQALLLPLYQRAGHGRRLLHAIYDLVVKDDVVELNVEDPAPAFVTLRNRVDYERWLEWKEKNENARRGDATVQQVPVFEPLSEESAQSVATALCTTTKQARIVYELDKLRQLHLEPNATDTLNKQYRLLVKKRLNKERREELATCRTKAEMQELLGKLYDECLYGYERILRSVHNG